MKKNKLLVTCLILWFGSVFAASSPNEWVACWISAIELSKNRNDYPDSEKAYSAAIAAQNQTQVPHLYLYNERAKLLLKMKKYEQAIADFSFVINHKEASKEDLLDALWGRGQTYLALGKTEEFEGDRKRLETLEPFVTTLEENRDYLILKLGNHVSREAQSQERLIRVLLMRKKIQSKNDVTFTPSGLAIVKKRTL